MEKQQYPVLGKPNPCQEIHNPINSVKYNPQTSECFDDNNIFIGYGRMKDGILQITQNKIS